MPFVALVCFLLAILCSRFSSSEFVSLNSQVVLRGVRHPASYETKGATDTLQEILIRASPVPIRDRLAVVILFYYHLGPEGHSRYASLHCSLSKLYEHVRPHTPTDAFIFVNHESRGFLPAWLETDFENLHVVSVDPKSWELPANLSPEHTWSAQEFGPDYRSMGRWRLTYGPDFARALGYQYLLSIDDDLFIQDRAPFAANLLDVFKEQSTAMAFRDRMVIDREDVLEGLPELVKFWIVTRKVKYPQGPLVEQFSPPTVDAMSSQTWNRVTYSNSFHLINLDFWFEPPVQDFLHLVLATGSDVTQRWSEQAVMNMIRLLFLPVGNVYLFPQASMVHAKVSEPRMYGLLQCEDSKEILRTYQAATQTGNVNSALHTDLRTIGFALDIAIPIDDLREFYTFYFVFNSTGCGGDTLTINGYANMHVHIEATTANPKPASYLEEVRAAYAKLSTEYFAHDGNGRRIEGVGCAEIIRIQLNDHYSFYCAYMGVSRPEWWIRDCELNRAEILRQYDKRMG